MKMGGGHDILPLNILLEKQCENGRGHGVSPLNMLLGERVYLWHQSSLHLTWNGCSTQTLLSYKVSIFIIFSL